MDEMTQIGNDLAQGKPLTERDLRRLLDCLRKFAGLRMSGERPSHTFQSTVLVNEAYLRLCGAGNSFRDSRNFFGVVAEAMRNILVDNARRKKVRKRDLEERGREGGGALLHDAQSKVDDILDLNDALIKLEAHDSELAELAKLRHFAGLSVEEAAAVLHIPERSAFRKWRQAKAWLFSYLTQDPASGKRVL